MVIIKRSFILLVLCVLCHSIGIRAAVGDIVVCDINEQTTKMSRNRTDKWSTWANGFAYIDNGLRMYCSKNNYSWVTDSKKKSEGIVLLSGTGDNTKGSKNGLLEVGYGTHLTIDAPEGYKIIGLYFKGEASGFTEGTGQSRKQSGDLSIYWTDPDASDAKEATIINNQKGKFYTYQEVSSTKDIASLVANPGTLIADHLDFNGLKVGNAVNGFTLLNTPQQSARIFFKGSNNVYVDYYKFYVILEKTIANADEAQIPGTSKAKDYLSNARMYLVRNIKTGAYLTLKDGKAILERTNNPDAELDLSSLWFFTSPFNLYQRGAEDGFYDGKTAQNDYDLQFHNASDAYFRSNSVDENSSKNGFENAYRNTVGFSSTYGVRPRYFGYDNPEKHLHWDFSYDNCKGASMDNLDPKVDVYTLRSDEKGGTIFNLNQVNDNGVLGISIGRYRTHIANHTYSDGTSGDVYDFKIMTPDDLDNPSSVSMKNTENNATDYLPKAQNAKGELWEFIQVPVRKYAENTIHKAADKVGRIVDADYLFDYNKANLDAAKDFSFSVNKPSIPDTWYRYYSQVPNGNLGGKEDKLNAIVGDHATKENPEYGYTKADTIRFSLHFIHLNMPDPNMAYQFENVEYAEKVLGLQHYKSLSGSRENSLVGLATKTFANSPYEKAKYAIQFVYPLNKDGVTETDEDNRLFKLRLAWPINGSSTPVYAYLGQIAGGVYGWVDKESNGKVFSFTARENGLKGNSAFCLEDDKEGLAGRIGIGDNGKVSIGENALGNTQQNWKITPVDIKPLLKSEVDLANRLVGAVGGPASKITLSSNGKSINEFMENAQKVYSNRVYFINGGYYRLYNIADDASFALRPTVNDEDEITSYMTCSPLLNDGGYQYGILGRDKVANVQKVYTKNTGQYVFENPQTGYDIAKVEADKDYVGKNDPKDAYFSLFQDGPFGLHSFVRDSKFVALNNKHQLVASKEDENIYDRWYLVPFTNQKMGSVAINNNEDSQNGKSFTARCYPYPVQVTDDAKAYYISAMQVDTKTGDTVSVVLTQYPDNKVPSKQPFIVIGKPGSSQQFNTELLTSEPSFDGDNILKGTITRIPFSEDLLYDNVRVLGYQKSLGKNGESTGMVFGKSKNNSFIEAYTCYILLSEVQRQAKCCRITFEEFPEVSGIRDVEYIRGSKAVYDMEGRRVATPSKGIYIQNGKKYVIK